MSSERPSSAAAAALSNSKLQETSIAAADCCSDLFACFFIGCVAEANL
jgi:hypothetical protein